MSNLDYKPPEPTKAQLEYARYLSRFQAPRGRRTLFARTESDIAAAFREEAANRSWNAGDLASRAGIDPRSADDLLQRGEAPIEAVFPAADALGIDKPRCRFPVSGAPGEGAARLDGRFSCWCVSGGFRGKCFPRIRQGCGYAHKPFPPS